MVVLSLTNQPPGVRFSPTDVELIDDYLKKKINGNDEEVIGFIPQHNFYKREPWEWPEFSGIESKDLEWFFFSPPDLKNPNSTNRFNRATKAGYWKVTGKDFEIWSGERLIGIKKFMVFHEGRTPNGKKTDWVMHEYHATPTELDITNPSQKTFVLCRLFKRPSQGSNVRKRKYSGKVGPARSKRTQASSSVSPALMQAEDYRTIDGTTSDSRAPVECGDNNFNVSSPEEAESDLRQASVSPASGEEGDNHVTRCYPTKTFDGKTSNTIAFTEYNPISDNAYITKNQAAQVTAGEVVDSNMSCVPPPELLDIDWSSLSTLLSLDPISPYEFRYNDHPNSQKNLAFDRETMENMESDMDDGSHSTAMAEIRNALLFDPTVQDSMWSEEINRKASSGLLNPGSSIRSTI